MSLTTADKMYHFKFTNTNDTFSLYFSKEMKKLNFIKCLKRYLQVYYTILKFELIEAGFVLNENNPPIELNTNKNKTLYELFGTNDAFYIRPIITPSPLPPPLPRPLQRLPFQENQENQENITIPSSTLPDPQYPPLPPQQPTFNHNAIQHYIFF